MASFLNAAAITSASGGPPSAPSSTPSTSAASCSSDGISECTRAVASYLKKDPGGAGTNTGTRITQTNLTSIPTHPSDRETTESAADSTAAAPERVRVSFLSCLGTVSYQIRILMYPECILSVS